MKLPLESVDLDGLFLTAIFLVDTTFGERIACFMAFEPERMALRVIEDSVRWKERLKRGFRIRLGMF